MSKLVEGLDRSIYRVTVAFVGVERFESGLGVNEDLNKLGHGLVAEAFTCKRDSYEFCLENGCIIWQMGTVLPLWAMVFIDDIPSPTPFLLSAPVSLDVVLAEGSMLGLSTVAIRIDSILLVDNFTRAMVILVWINVVCGQFILPVSKVAGAVSFVVICA